MEQIYLVQAVQPSARSELSRLVKTAKLHFVDSGLLAALWGFSTARLRSQRGLGGTGPQSLVFSELLKAAAWSEEQVAIFHSRDEDQLEVDFVLENPAGQIVGIEVKAAPSVSQRDSGGVQRMAAGAGCAFVQGIWLYPGAQTLPFGPNIRAAPLSPLWA